MFGFKVICWALLFIFKLRFPPGVSISHSEVDEWTWGRALKSAQFKK
jgi:hypothetical protein